jgi:hypothetical protein
VQEYVILYKISQSADRVRDCCDLSFRLPDVAANCRFVSPDGAGVDIQQVC